MTAIALFVYRRPLETSLVLSAIERYQPSHLYIFADGPKVYGGPEEADCLETRRIASDIQLEGKIELRFRDLNVGLKRNILEGLDEVFSSHDSAIVLEDDCLPSEGFFDFIDLGLELASSDPRIGIVSGDYFGRDYANSSDGYLCGHPRIWGWATRSSTWLAFRESIPESWIERSSSRARRAAIPGLFERALFARLLRNVHRLDSWAVPFACFIHSQGFLCLNPTANLVQNMGFSRHATHTNRERFFLAVPSSPRRFQNQLVVRQRDLAFEARVSRDQFMRLVSRIWKPEA